MLCRFRREWPMLALAVVSTLMATACHAFSLSMSTPASSKHVLYDVPVSNNGARCRIVAYKKDLPDTELTILPPTDIGGLKSEEYLKISPQGKMPALVSHDDNTAVAESDSICRYLMSQYADRGPSFQPDNPKSNMIARYHDMYLTTIQNCLYKPSPPYGIYGTREDAQLEFSKQLHIIAGLITEDDGPYLCGSEVSLADATLFPTVVFAVRMYPKFDFGIEDAIPAEIRTWFDAVIEQDEVFRKVYNEIMAGIQKWEDNGRWDPIWRAGQRDEEPGTLFDKIVAGEIPANVVHEDDKVLAFRDINPAAPAHVLVIPKDRDGLTRLRKATLEHVELLGRLLLTAGQISNDESLGFGDGSRVVINDGKDAGQEVFHLHLHVLGGRDFTWPPG